MSKTRKNEDTKPKSVTFTVAVDSDFLALLDILARKLRISRMHLTRTALLLLFEYISVVKDGKLYASHGFANALKLAEGVHIERFTDAVETTRTVFNLRSSENDNPFNIKGD